MKNNKKQTYAEAVKRLEEISSQMNSGDLDVDTLADLLKEAKELIAFCRQKLYDVDKQVKEIMAEN